MLSLNRNIQLTRELEIFDENLDHVDITISSLDFPRQFRSRHLGYDHLVEFSYVLLKPEIIKDIQVCERHRVAKIMEV